MKEREYFENAIIQKLNVPQNPMLIKEIQDKTKLIQPHQFMEFIGKLSEKREYHKPDEKFDAVVKEFEDELISGLFKEVPEQAKILEKKLIALFMQIENLFNHNHKTYDEMIVERMESATKYIQQAKISVNDFWTANDIEVIGKIGLGRCYTIFNSSYAKLDKALEDEMKSFIVLSNMVGNRKQITSKMDIKRIGR